MLRWWSPWPQLTASGYSRVMWPTLIPDRGIFRPEGGWQWVWLPKDSSVLCLVSQSCPTLCDPMDYSPPDSSVHGDSPGKTTGVGCHAFLQGIFPIQDQGSNPGLLLCRWILNCLSHRGSPRILEWVVYPFSRGSSQPRNWTGVFSLQVDSLPAELPGKPESLHIYI